MESLIDAILGLGRNKWKRQASHRAQLRVEALEPRELLSAVVAPRYVLINGNLFQQTGATRKLVDRRVLQYAVGKGKATVYCLETDGGLHRFGVRASRRGTLIDGNIQSFTLAKDGLTITENRRDGTTWQVQKNGTKQQIGGQPGRVGTK